MEAAAAGDNDRKEYAKETSAEQEQHDSGCEQSPTTLSPNYPSSKAENSIDESTAELRVYDRVCSPLQLAILVTKLDQS